MIDWKKRYDDVYKSWQHCRNSYLVTANTCATYMRELQNANKGIKRLKKRVKSLEERLHDHQNNDG